MDVFVLALRYLVSRRIALVCVFSVAVGVMALVTLNSLMDGVHRFFRESIKGVQADLWIEAVRLPPSYGNRHFEFVRDELAPEMATRGGPLAALAPRQLAIAVLAPGEHPRPDDRDRFRTAILHGVDLERERELVPIEKLLDDVSDAALRVPPDRRAAPLAPVEGRPAIILGNTLARDLGVAVEERPDVPDVVYVFCGQVVRDDEDRPRFEGRGAPFEVAGCFTAGREDFDGSLAYVDRRALQRLRFGDAVRQRDASRIYVRLAEGVDLAATARRLRVRHPRLGVVTWVEENVNYLTALRDQKAILVVILAFIIFVACAAILGLIAMLVLEKRRDIGILRSMGMGRLRVVLVFVAYGLALSAVGSVVGVLLGLQVTANLDGVVSTLSDWFGVELVDEAVYKFKTVPTHTEPGSVLAILAGVFGGTLVSSLIPALRAAFIDPVRCLRDD